MSVSLDRARAHWYAKSGLVEPVAKEVEDVIARTGWVRTLGGVDAYLAVRARAPGMTREAIDAAVSESRVQVIPAVRGCIYLVPRAHVPLALRIAESLAVKRMDKELVKAGVKGGVADRELDALGKAIVKALAKGPLGTDALRKALPEGAARGLGEAGKKVGLSSTLPPVLRLLEFKGAIERTLAGGHLDTERYLWRVTSRSPFEGATMTAQTTQLHAELAAVFAQQVGPVSVADFASWSGLGKREAAAACEKARLAKIAVDGYAGDAWVTEADLALLKKPAPQLGGVSFLSLEDTYLTLHGGTATVTAAKHHAREMKSLGTTGASTLGEAAHVLTRTVVLDGLIEGFWEWDAAAGEVVYALFDGVPAKRKGEVARAAESLAAFIGTLGHARSFSLDTDALVKERAAEVRKMA
jgi:hypothetical protein